jgi:hypothetical protein
MTDAFLSALHTASQDASITNKTRAADAVFRVLSAHRDIFDKNMSRSYICDVMRSCLDISFSQYEYSDSYIQKFVGYNAQRLGYLAATRVEYANRAGTTSTRMIFCFT